MSPEGGPKPPQKQEDFSKEDEAKFVERIRKCNESVELMMSTWLLNNHQEAPEVAEAAVIEMRRVSHEWRDFAAEMLGLDRKKVRRLIDGGSDDDGSGGPTATH